MLVDTHAHLYWDSYQEGFDSIIQRAVDNDVKLIINIGVDLETSKKCLELSSDKIRFYSTIGIHPHDAPQQARDKQSLPIRFTQDKATIDESIRQLMGDLEILYHQHPAKIAAIGECGLDYFFRDEFSNSLLSHDESKQLQMKLYKAQVLLAKKLNLPLAIHCRESWQDIFIPELIDTTGVFHNFSGSKEDSLHACKLGYYLSFSCVLSYPKNQDLRDLVKMIPLDRILTETDCPFLPPQQIRGQRNEPANISGVIKIISEIKQIPFDEVAHQILKNTQKLFKIDQTGI